MLATSVMVTATDEFWKERVGREVNRLNMPDAIGHAGVMYGCGRAGTATSHRFHCNPHLFSSFAMSSPSPRHIHDRGRISRSLNPRDISYRRQQNDYSDMLESPRSYHEHSSPFGNQDLARSMPLPPRERPPARNPRRPMSSSGQAVLRGGRRAEF